MEKEGLYKKALKHPNILLFSTIVLFLSVLMLIAYTIGALRNDKPDHEEKVTQISLKDIGELATQEAYITVVEPMSDDRKLLENVLDVTVPFTESICIFSHDFIITAGYQFDEIIPIVTEGTEETKGKIEISLPEAEILSNGIVPDSEKVYYERESIFKNLSEADKAELRGKMGEKAETQAIENGLLVRAKENAKKVLSNFVYNFYSPDEYEIIYTDAKN